jgi:flagellar basal-body rod protein FlgC
MPVNNLFGVFDISASGLSAQRKNLEVRASNIANSQSIDPKTGGPYAKREVQFAEISPSHGFKGALNRVRLRLRRFSNDHLPNLIDREKEVAMGVEAEQFQVQNPPTKRIYAPEHPKADEEGYLEVADINPVTEMVKLLSAARAYEANATVLSAAKSMFKKALEI